MGHKRCGRPPKPASSKLVRSINLKLSAADYFAVEQRAEKAGLSPTAYARRMTLKGRVVARYMPDEIDSLRKIAGMANNFNQLSRRANAAGFTVAASALAGLLVELKRIVYGGKEH